MDQTFTEIECKILNAQKERRNKFRREFLKARTDPCKHMTESGFVFDAAMARYESMKAKQLEHFQPNIRTIRFGVLSILPMFIYGYILWKDRADREHLIRTGKIPYRNRHFKFA